MKRRGLFAFAPPRYHGAMPIEPNRIAGDGAGDATRLHRLHPEHIALLDQIAPGVFGDPVVPALLAQYLANPVNLMVLAVAQGVVVGRVTAVIHRHVDKPADLYIDELAVADTHRRQRLASRLIAEVTAWAAEQGCADCWLAAEAGNAAARALYERLGSAKPCVLYYWDLDGV